jgi:hypothetical protein
MHELSHSTGHSKRLDRKLYTEPHIFGSAKYGREELIAEMVSCYLTAHAGIQPATIENQAAYLAGWITTHPRGQEAPSRVPTLTSKGRNMRHVLMVVMLTCGIAHADISGFGNFSGFTVNQGDPQAVPSIAPGSFVLTGTGPVERRSIFNNTPQSISQFTASFSYVGGYDGGTDGANFVIQNSPSGVHALGESLYFRGYGSGGITNSAALSLELYTATQSGLFTGGVEGSSLPSGSPLTSPVNLHSGDLINVALTYDGSILHEQLLDTVTANTYSASFLANIPSLVGGSTALVGITASTNGGINQTFSNFQFTSVPEPSCLLLIGTLGLLRRR